VIFGAVLVVSGIAYLLGALLVTYLGSGPDDTRWLYVIAAAFVLTGAVAVTLDGRLPRVSKRSRGARFAIGVFVVAGCVYASSRVGIPKTLPGIALGWPLLFHVERGAALIGAIGLVALVLWRGAKGEWPIGFANLFEYAPKQAVEVAADTLKKQNERISDLERDYDARLERHDARIRAAEEALP
jgi:hypothetical protein